MSISWVSSVGGEEGGALLVARVVAIYLDWFFVFFFWCAVVCLGGFGFDDFLFWIK